MLNQVSRKLLEKFIIITDFGEIGDGGSELDVRLGTMLAGSSQIRYFEWRTGQHALGIEMEPIHLATIPFGNLRQLKLSCNMAFSCCLEVLRHTPLLECCEFIYVQNNHDADPPFSHPICLPHLRSLCVKTDRQVGEFLENLTLPSIKRIEIVFRTNCGDEDSDTETAEDFGPWPHAVFLSLLHRSDCSLEELILVSPVSEDELLEYLQILSATLKTLSLRGKYGWASIGQHVLNLLTIPPGTDTKNVACPNLINLRFNDCILGPLPRNSMGDMIQSRIMYFAALDGCQAPLDVQFIAPAIDLDEEDWRRLYVSKRRSARNVKMSLEEL